MNIQGQIDLKRFFTDEELLRWMILEVRDSFLLFRRHNDPEYYDYDEDDMDFRKQVRLEKRTKMHQDAAEKQLIHDQRVDILMTALARLESKDA